MIKRAVIYCRVSSADQVENTSLPMQAKQCTDYCNVQGWDIAKIIIEEGESAKTTDRKELLKLLIYCREKSNRVGYIVVWKVDRFARNLYDYLQLKKEMAGIGISIRSVSEPFKDDPEGKLMESIFATFAQYDNDLRAKRCKEGMYSRLKDGYWVTKPPLGYKSSRTADNKPTIIEDLTTAPYIRTAFEMASKGVYSQQQIVDYLNSIGMRAKQASKFTHQALSKILKNRAYIGEIKIGSGAYVPGKHTPIIDRTLFDRVQALLKENSNLMVPHTRVNPDFPLRKFVTCSKCGTPLTGAFSTGKSGKKYPYYRCPKSDCMSLNIRKEKLEQQFFDLLDGMKPVPEYLNLLNEAILLKYTATEADNIAIKTNLQTDISKCEQQIERLTEALAEGVLRPEDYKKTFDKIESKRLVKTLELQDLKVELIEIETVLVYAKYVVMNAGAIWQESNIDQRTHLQTVFFPNGLQYGADNFESPQMGLFFEFCAGKAVFQKTSMVVPRGIEPLLQE